MFVEDAFDKHLRVGKNPSDQRHQGVHFDLHHGGHKRGQDLLDGRIWAGCLQQLESLLVDGLDPAGHNRIDQAVFGLKMVVDGRQIHVRRGCDVT